VRGEPVGDALAENERWAARDRDALVMLGAFAALLDAMPRDLRLGLCAVLCADLCAACGEARD
jgi:hypothetical protein